MEEPRRLIKFGNSSYVISIPREWILKHNLKKGDFVYLENSKNRLILSAKEQDYSEEEKKVFINVKNRTPRNVRREILSSYANNFNYFEIEGNIPKEMADEIKLVLSGLIGMEIIEASKSKIIAKDYLDIRAIELDKVVRRIDNTIRSMFEELRKGLEAESFKKANYNEIYEADDILNSLFFLVCKLAKKGLGNTTATKLLKTSPEELSSYHWMAMNFENIGDELKRLARFLLDAKLKDKDKKTLLNLCNDIETVYLMLMNTVYSKDKSMAREIMESKRNMIEKCRSFCNTGDNIMIARITERLEAISILMNNISRLILY